MKTPPLMEATEKGLGHGGTMNVIPKASFSLTVPLLACLTAYPIPAAEPTKAQTASSPLGQDRELLAGLIKQILFDPKGAQRVMVTTVQRSVWASSGKILREGWLVKGKHGRQGKVYFTDGEYIPAPAGKDLKEIDFVAACRLRYARKPAGQKDIGNVPFQRFQRNAAGPKQEESDLVVAAWLYRLGQERLAALALAQTQQARGKAVEALRKELAWSAFAGMVHAYMVRADDEALAHGQRLLRLYPKEAKEFEQAGDVVAELKRRKKQGTFGQPAPEKWPDAFTKLSTRKKVAFLIDALEEVDSRQNGQPGGVDLASDRRVKALIAVGDAAVPQLIAAIDKDERLTRSVHFWRDFGRSRQVLGVREAALTAVMSILRTQVFEPRGTGDNFTGRGKEKAKQVAAHLQIYWKKYGSLPFDQRMMKILTDPKTKAEALREAAYNLGRLGEDRTLGTTVWTGRASGRPKGPNPAVAKFAKPSVAEAILAAMDRDLAAHDATKRDSLYDYRRREIEDAYLGPLIDLGDKGIAPVLAKRCREAGTVRMRRKWAFACHLLSEPKPLKAFARDFQAGKVNLPKDDKPDTNAWDQPGTVELRGIVRYLASVGTPVVDRALMALADVKHPYHALAARWVLSDEAGWHIGSPWLEHPFCLAILRQGLDDSRPTGATFKIWGENLVRITVNGSSPTGIPWALADPAARKAEAKERACDRAAERLKKLMIGLPDYHPLLRGADKSLEQLKKSFDRFRGRYRRATLRELKAWGGSSYQVFFLPDIRPLGHAATAKDVKAGRAIFHLRGRGKPADLKLPAVGAIDGNRGTNVLIVQAEMGPGGAVTYGVIGFEGIRAVSGKKVSSIRPLDSRRALNEQRGKDSR
jgi:hypothetical protein